MFCKYNITSLDPRTFVIEEKTPASQALCYLLCGEDAALLIDTGMPFGNMKKVADRLTSLPVTVVNTHAHVDHIGSNHRFDAIFYHEDDKPVFALHTDPKYIAELIDYAIPPNVRFAAPIVKRLARVNPAGQYSYVRDGHIFDLGGRDVEVIHTPGHSAGCVCLLDRAARMLFTGDTLCEWGILLDLAGSCAPETYLASVRRIKALSPSFDRILPGHHGWPVDKGYIDEYEACAAGILNGSAEIEPGNNNRAAKYGRVLIMLPTKGGA